MAGIQELSTLLRSLNAAKRPGNYVFVTFAPAASMPRLTREAIASFQEPEGLSLVIDQRLADEECLAYDDVFALICLRVHSSLAAVGLTAAVSAALTAVGISANVVAAYHHDYVFVPVNRVGEALATLSKLSSSAESQA